MLCRSMKRIFCARIRNGNDLIMNIFLKLDKVIACELLMSMILFILEFFFDRYCSVLIKCKDW